MNKNRVVDRDRITALERKRDHERKKKNLTINIYYKHLLMKFGLLNNFKL
jgi:hypothetical protein